MFDLEFEYGLYYCLQNVLGSWSSKLFAVALLASGQSSTITGTYAGQYVMQVLCYCMPHSFAGHISLSSHN